MGLNGRDEESPKNHSMAMDIPMAHSLVHVINPAE